MNKLLQFQEGSLKVSTPAIDLTAVELIKNQIYHYHYCWSNSCHKARYEHVVIVEDVINNKMFFMNWDIFYNKSKKVLYQKNIMA